MFWEKVVGHAQGALFDQISFRKLSVSAIVDTFEKSHTILIRPYAVNLGYRNEELYRRAMAEMSLIDTMRSCLICDIRLCNFSYAYIDELFPEQEFNCADGNGLFLSLC